MPLNAASQNTARKATSKTRTVLNHFEIMRRPFVLAILRGPREVTEDSSAAKPGRVLWKSHAEVAGQTCSTALHSGGVWRIARKMRECRAWTRIASNFELPDVHSALDGGG